MNPFSSPFFNLSARVGRLFGIPIKLHITILFFLLPALTRLRTDFLWGLEYAVGIVLSILIHELGHALTAKRYGMTGLSITLHGFGGFASSSGPRSPRQSLVISLAGPGATFALGLLLLGIGTLALKSPALGDTAFDQASLVYSLGRVNILLGFLNLIPVLPWDGGQALQALLAHRMPPFKATRAAAHIGLVIAVPLLVYGLFVGGFFSLFAFVGLLTCYQTLATSGGIRFGEMLDDRKRRQEVEAVKRREQARQDAYLDEVKQREKERADKEKLRKLLEGD